MLEYGSLQRIGTMLLCFYLYTTRGGVVSGCASPRLRCSSHRVCSVYCCSRRVPIIQLLQPLLQDYEQDNHLELLKAEEKLATKLGDNFLSAVYRIAVSGKRKNGSEYRGSFIRKIRLNENQLTKQMRDDKMFENEAYFYNNIYPINGSFAPKPVLATVDQIILEDLGDRGYVVLSRKDLLDFKHTDEVVKAMASMHAFYLSYKLNHPEEFVKLIAPIKENVFPKDDNISPGRFYELGFDTAKKSLETIADSSPQARRGLRFLRFFEKDLYNTLKSMIDPTKNDSKYWTLTHGDLWNNNLMFLQDNQEEILRLKFLDYQVIRHMSPATDFVYLVYSSCKPERRTSAIFFQERLVPRRNRASGIIRYGGCSPGYARFNVRRRRDRSYACNWYEFPPKARLLLLMMLLRTSKPCVMTAGPGVPMNYETSSKVHLFARSDSRVCNRALGALARRYMLENYPLVRNVWASTPRESDIFNFADFECHNAFITSVDFLYYSDLCIRLRASCIHRQSKYAHEQFGIGRLGAHFVACHALLEFAINDPRSEGIIRVAPEATTVQYTLLQYFQRVAAKATIYSKTSVGVGGGGGAEEETVVVAKGRYTRRVAAKLQAIQPRKEKRRRRGSYYYYLWGGSAAQHTPSSQAPPQRGALYMITTTPSTISQRSGSPAVDR
uniref:CHK kinase-like domain-containing protein n=1 Tax=Trichogramma kaykai TaxID=54128 RepID=A0ABD2WL31_9HYME